MKIFSVVREPYSYKSHSPNKPDSGIIEELICIFFFRSFRWIFSLFGDFLWNFNFVGGCFAPIKLSNRIEEITLLPLWKKTIQNYSENHYLKLLKTIGTIHQC